MRCRSERFCALPAELEADRVVGLTRGADQDVGHVRLRGKPLVCLGERRCGAEPREDLAGRGEGRCRFLRSSERHQAAPLTEQGLRLLVGHADPKPEVRGLAVAVRRLSLATSFLAERLTVCPHGPVHRVAEADLPCQSLR